MGSERPGFTPYIECRLTHGLGLLSNPINGLAIFAVYVVGSATKAIGHITLPLREGRNAEGVSGRGWGFAVPPLRQI